MKKILFPLILLACILVACDNGFKPESGFTLVPLESQITTVQPMTGLVMWTTHSQRLRYAPVIQLEFQYCLPCRVVTGKVDGKIQYDWSYFEQILDDMKSRNHQGVIRFRYEYPGNTLVDGEPGSTAVPQYIKDLEDYNETFKKNEDGPTYYADWTNKELQWFTKQFYSDFAERYNNDPRIVEKTSPVRQLHFEEAAELAYFGAKILHPTCIQPAKYANIPVRLLNTMDPTAPGTLISNDTELGKIKAVAAKDNITAIQIKSGRMLLAYGFLRKVFEIFESYQTSIDMICTSEVGVSVSIDDTKHLNEIVNDLKKYGIVHVDHDMCIICVVGDLRWENVGFEAKALDAMREIPVRMISFGGSDYNISFLVSKDDKKRALQSLSDHLFNN